LSDIDTFPALDTGQFRQIDEPALLMPEHSTHAPPILLLYGSLRERSYSRFATQEAARILRRFGAETRIFNPEGLPLPDGTPADHPKVQELRDLAV
jgi:arsenic resistance protein ArsH